ncbi:WRKY51 [Artemisia annua]|uniref:WRKY51 n=1 Tax=Artemisia annua TaxID=35608 RepID=A0A2U1LJL6_ARTAN|nr:WRKY51 [Artemisia annua]
MDAYDPMSNESYGYRSVDSPDNNYDVPHQQNSDFFDNFFVFDEWMNEDQASIVPEYQDHTLAYASAVIIAILFHILLLGEMIIFSYKARCSKKLVVNN